MTLYPMVRHTQTAFAVRAVPLACQAVLLDPRAAAARAQWGAVNNIHHVLVLAVSACCSRFPGLVARLLRLTAPALSCKSQGRFPGTKTFGQRLDFNVGGGMQAGRRAGPRYNFAAQHIYRKSDA